MPRLLRDEDHARQDERVIPRQDHAERRIALRPRQRIRPEEVVSDQVLAGGDALDHRRRVGLELDVAGAHRREQGPERGHGDAVLREEEKPDR